MEMSVGMVKDILELNAAGYSRLEITQIIMKKYDYDEDYCFDTVRSILTKARKQMTEAEKQQIELNRKLHKEASKVERENIRKELATLVKDRAESDALYTKTSTKLQQSIKSIAMLKGVSEEMIREYTKQFYPEFYEEYSTDANLDEDYFLKLAYKIIDKSISKSDAQHMMGFPKMMKYLEEKNPTLLEKVNDTFAFQNANSARSFEFASTTRININNLNMLIDILLEYRMPLEDMCVFLSENHEIFLHNAQIILPEDLDKYLRVTSTSNSLEWYLAEMNLDATLNIPVEYIERKKERFNDFAMKFRILKNDMSRLEKYVSAETIVPMASVMQKVNDHIYKDSYYFTNDDVRNLLKNIYKYGLTELEIKQYYGVPRIANSSIVRNFEPQNVDDQILIAGYRKMANYHADYFYSRLQGRS